MIGKPEGPSGTCALCGGTLQQGDATIPFLKGDRVYTIRKVPALVCADCKEAYMTGLVVDRIQGLLEHLEGLGAEIMVAQYRAA